MLSKRILAEAWVGSEYALGCSVLGGRMLADVEAVDAGVSKADFAIWDGGETRAILTCAQAAFPDTGVYGSGVRESVQHDMTAYDLALASGHWDQSVLSR